MTIKHLVLIFTLLSVNATYAGETTVPTQQEYAQAIINALGSDSARFRQMIGALSAYCGTEENFSTGLGGRCEDMFNVSLDGDGRVIKRILGWLRGRETVQQARVSSQIMTTQQANIATRIAQLRVGINNSFSGLNISTDTASLPISKLGYMANDEDESDYGALGSPWGFFINGQITNGDYSYSDARNEGFDFDTTGITMGIDYRFSPKFVAGLAMGYADFDSSADAVTVIQSETKALTFSAYGSYNPTDNFYVDLRASFGNSDIDQTRTIGFNLAGRDTNLAATSSTDGKQNSFIVSTGYQFNTNGWQLTPSISAEYSNTTVDAFKEDEAAVWNVGWSEQKFRTSRYTIGFQANKSISLSNGVLIPSFNYSIIHENQKGGNILMRVSGMPAGEFFEATSKFNDSDYNSARLGLTFVSSNGKQAYIQYAKVFSWDGFDISTLNFGARFEF